MAYVPLARAVALPGDGVDAPQSSRWTALSDHARRRSERVSHLLVHGDDLVERTWAQTARVVELAAAGLTRSGLRVDQVVVSLLPGGHAWPELDLALRAIGAVVVHVAPDTTPEDLVRDLTGVDVRLVVVEDAGMLGRLAQVSFPSAQLFALDGGRGWDRLLQLGAERLTMDPEAVTRVDRAVDPEGAVPRVLGNGRPLGRVSAAPALRDDLVGPEDVVLVACDPADAWGHRVRDAQLAVGATLCQLPPGADLLATLVRVRATVLLLDAESTRVVVEALEAPPAPRPRRALRRPPAPGTRPPLGDHLRLLATVAVDPHGREVLAACGVVVRELGEALVSAPDLPLPPVSVRGDVADLPRRSRSEPDPEFRLAVDREPGPDEPREQEEPAASAFVLPSLPLFGGESFLDALLIARAREDQQ